MTTRPIPHPCLARDKLEADWPVVGRAVPYPEVTMPAASRQRKSMDDNANAAAAFDDFVALGDGRSLAKLADQYQSDTEPTPTKRLRTLKEWSAKYGWVARIAEAEEHAAESKLREAARLDADTFLKTSRELNSRAAFTSAVPMDELVRMRESVRKPQPKGGTAVNVKVSVEVRQLAEQMAESLGMDAEELIREAEAIAAGEWERAG